MNKKIIFVEPMGKTNVFSHYMNYPLLGPIYLATILKKAGHDVKVYNENILGRKIRQDELNADFLCVTGLTSTIKRGYEISRQFKAKNPDGKVIIGGIHASFIPDEAIKFADHVVIGEGENVILEVINGREEKFIYSTPTDMDKVPSPNFSLLVNSKGMSRTPVMTSRGCPFNCNFCAVTEMFGRKYRTSSIDKVIEDIKLAKTKRIFFYDDNFTADKKRTYALLERMRKERFNFKWSAQVRVDVTKDIDLIKKMSNAGCDQVFVGFESINPQTLKCLNKGQSVDEIKKSIKIFQDNGINVHGMFIFGSDEDDTNVFKRTSNFCNSYNIDSVQFLSLTPIPGTPIFQKFDSEHRLLHKNWDYYDGMHVVFKPKNMSALELQNGIIDSFKDFYSYTQATNEAINLFFKTSLTTIKSFYSNVKMPSFHNLVYRIMGKSIVRKWLKQNRSYLSYLSRC